MTLSIARVNGPGVKLPGQVSMTPGQVSMFISLFNSLHQYIGLRRLGVEPRCGEDFQESVYGIGLSGLLKSGLMAGHGDNRDYGGGNRDQGDVGREGSGYRDYGAHTEATGVIAAMVATGDMECPHPRRNAYPGTSANRGGSSSPGRLDQTRRSQLIDPLESKVAEIGKSVTVVCQYVEIEQQKRAEKERRKAEKKEAEERAEAERAEALLKKEEEEKALKEAERKEELHKSLDIKMALRIGELRQDVREDVRQEIRDAIGELCRVVTRVKQKATETVEPANESSTSSSETDELSLCPSPRRENEDRKRCLKAACKWSCHPSARPEGHHDREACRQCRENDEIYESGNYDTHPEEDPAIDSQEDPSGHWACRTLEI
ncbi:hypothetical protein CBR_g30601 [Chara braunii]|uniref:Uncharacterized protein n=1 Tax=Chara braunii TaxID=69332 RepID=A0A388LD63_CHABU|nr:hypothetical protein CBR_g30601 [Chara braunii]|eukprot:GBG80236.1 hypothetical protein CBR_g30601 [Chara braunii]